jgi:glycosyltransferase involved in cell wall biosynthesis
MRIGIVIFGLYWLKGGGERFAVNLAHAMCQRGHECILIHQGIGCGHPSYPIPDKTQTLNLALSDIQSIHIARSGLINANIDVLCALVGGHEMLWIPTLCNNTGIPLLISEHRSPYVVEEKLLNRQERLACMSGADAIHLLSNTYLYSLPNFLHKKTMIIPNPAPISRLNKIFDRDTIRKRLLAIGRFDDEVKQFSILIKAFAHLAQDFTDWDLCICGDGPDKQRYIKLINELNIRSRVELPGIVDDIDEFYITSHLFCLPSHDEAFGIVVVEAQNYGLPVVGFAGCSGVNEIIVDGENGLLVTKMDVLSLAESLRRLMNDSYLRQKFGEKGHIMLNRYDAEKIYNQWEIFFKAISSFKNKTHLNYPALSEQKKSELILNEILSRSHPQTGMICENCHIRQIRRKNELQAGATMIRSRIKK